MSRAWCSCVPGAVRLALQVMPNAKKTEVVKVVDDALKLKLQAQPIEGKANEALIRFLAAALAVPRSAITITHGQTNKRKLVEVASLTLTPEEVEQLLGVPAG
jgi:uncharacterized protein